MNNYCIFDDLSELLIYLKYESECSLFAELCSMIGLTKDKKFAYKQMQNRSKEPSAYFIIDPYDYLSFVKDHLPLCIFHSHLVGNEDPSEFDIKTSENCCFPFLIYSICSEKFSLYEPQYKDYDVTIIEGLRKII
jgi:proteasome lid subunit RPN8/RPN11